MSVLFETEVEGDGKIQAALATAEIAGEAVVKALDASAEAVSPLWAWLPDLSVTLSAVGILLALIVLLPLLLARLSAKPDANLETEVAEMLRGAEPPEPLKPQISLPADVRRHLEPVLTELSRSIRWVGRKRRWRNGDQGDGLKSLYSRLGDAEGGDGPQRVRRRSDIHSYGAFAERLEPAARFSLDALSQWTVFGGQELALLEKLARSAVAETRAPGDVLFRTGEAMRDLYIVKTGKVDLVARAAEGAPFLASQARSQSLGNLDRPGRAGRPPPEDFVARVGSGGVVASMLTLLSFLTDAPAEAPVTARVAKLSVVLKIPALEIIQSYAKTADKKVLRWLLRKLMMRVNRVTLMTMYGYLGIIYDIPRAPHQAPVPLDLAGPLPESGLLNEAQTSAVYALVRDALGVAPLAPLPPLELLNPRDQRRALSGDAGGLASPEGVQFLDPSQGLDRLDLGRAQSCENSSAPQTPTAPRSPRLRHRSLSLNTLANHPGPFLRFLSREATHSPAAPLPDSFGADVAPRSVDAVPLPYSEAKIASPEDPSEVREGGSLGGVRMQLMYIPPEKNVVEMDEFAGPALYIVVAGQLVVKSVQEQPLVYKREGGGGHTPRKPTSPPPPSPPRHRPIPAAQDASFEGLSPADAPGVGGTLADLRSRWNRRSLSAGDLDDKTEGGDDWKVAEDDDDGTDEDADEAATSLWSFGGLGNLFVRQGSAAEGGDDRPTELDASVVGVHGPGTMVGQLSLLTDSSVDWYGSRLRKRDRSQPPPMLSIRSSCATWVVRVGREAHDELLEKNPDVVTQAARRLTEELPSLLKVFDFGCTWVVLDAGEVLHSQGQPCTGDLHVVLHGNLRTSIHVNPSRGPFVAPSRSAPPRPTSHVLSNLGRGSLVGESEILTRTPYGSTVTAARHCSLARIPGSLLLHIMKSHPSVYAHLAQHVSSKMAAALRAGGPHGLQGSTSAGPLPREATLRDELCRTIFVVPISPSVPHDHFCQTLCQALLRLGLRVQLVTSGEAAAAAGLGFGAGVWRTENVHKAAEAYLAVSGWLNAREELNDLVLYQADWAAGSQWNHICASCADRTLFVANASDTPGIMPLEQELDVDETQTMLIMLHVFQGLRMPEGYEPKDTKRWMERREKIHSHHHIRLHAQDPRFDQEHHRSDFARLGRILTGRAIGLVLGGGGARGMSHMSIIRCLEEENIPIDMVCGTSIGAFIGALYASSPSYFDCRRQAHAFANRMGNVWMYIADLTWPAVSYFSGFGFNAGIFTFLGKHTKIEDLWLNYSCVTTDLTTGSPMVHRNGTLWRYVRASMSLAGYLPPLCDEDPRTGRLHYLVDGGYVNVLPADVMHTLMGARTVIAADVSGDWTFGGYNYGDHLNGFRVLLSRLNPFGNGMKTPAMAEISEQLAFVASQRTMDEVREQHINLFLQPPVEKYSTLAFSHFQEIESIGYGYARPLIRSWKASVLRGGGDAAASIAPRLKA